MTLQSSGAISLQNIQAEFGGPSSNITLQNYYAGGSYVAAGTKNGSGVAIPSSGAIKLEDFYGASAIVISGSSYSIFSQGAAGGSSSGQINFNPNGSISHSGSGTVIAGQYSGPANWATPTSTGLGSNYELIVDSTSSSILPTSESGPTVGSWTGMGGTLSFSASNSGNRGPDYTWNCRIRNATTLVVLASFSVNVSLENT